MHPGKIIHHYKAESYLGGGGMGEVWLAIDQRNRRYVAIKSLHPQLLNHDIVRQRFRNEALTLKKLRHPNIIALYDYIEEPNGCYLVMEYFEGETLDEFILLRTGPIPEPKLISLFSQILQGFAFAHAQKIIHRDIKPENFMVNRSGKVKILDFGIAKALGDEKGMTQLGTRLGTVFYMSPEQVQGHPTNIASDIYSLGVTVFQMATGQKPYPEELTEFEIYREILEQPLPRARSLYPAVSGHLQAVVDKATEKKPAERFPNCAAFLTALTDNSFSHIPASRKKKAPTSSYSQTESAHSHLEKGTPGGEARGQRNRKNGNVTLPKGEGLEKVRTRRRIWASVVVIALLGFFTIGLVGLGQGWLGTGTGENPEEVASHFLNAFKQNDSPKAYRYGNTECDENLDLMFSLREDSEDFAQYQVRTSEIDGNKATVFYDKELFGEKTSHTLNLVRKWDRWKVSCAHKL